MCQWLEMDLVRNLRLVPDLLTASLERTAALQSKAEDTSPLPQLEMEAVLLVVVTAVRVSLALLGTLFLPAREVTHALVKASLTKALERALLCHLPVPVKLPLQVLHLILVITPVLLRLQVQLKPPVVDLQAFPPELQVQGLH